MHIPFAFRDTRIIILNTRKLYILIFNLIQNNEEELCARPKIWRETLRESNVIAWTFDAKIPITNMIQKLDNKILAIVLTLKSLESNLIRD